MPQGGGVREIAHTSTDGGATWRPLFDIFFQPHKAGAAMPDTSESDRTAAETRDGTHGTSRYTDVYVLMDGSWKAVSAQITRKQE